MRTSKVVNAFFASIMAVVGMMSTVAPAVAQEKQSPAVMQALTAEHAPLFAVNDEAEWRVMVEESVNRPQYDPTDPEQFDRVAKEFVAQMATEEAQKTSVVRKSGVNPQVVKAAIPVINFTGARIVCVFSGCGQNMVFIYFTGANLNYVNGLSIIFLTTKPVTNAPAMMLSKTATTYTVSVKVTTFAHPWTIWGVDTLGYVLTQSNVYTF